MPVLDASAVLALTYRETGHDTVADLVSDGVISAVNWSEVLQKITAHGGDADQIGNMLQALGLRIAPFGQCQARAAARLYPRGRALGLSLADRACLALAVELAQTVITSDRAWAECDVDVDVHLIR